jgi:hypothetical protein
MPAAGIFLCHHRSPRIRRHFERLVEESGHLVTWHFVFSPDSGARPEAPFAYEDPAEVMGTRYAAMVRHGGVEGGYLDALFVPVLRALPGDRLWLIEYDVDYAGRWSELFEEFADNDADLLTTTVMSRHEHPRWPHWETAHAPAWVPEDRIVRSLNPLMRVSRDLLTTYALAMADEEWRGNYEFTLPTVAVASGARVEDLGSTGSFTPPERRSRIYVGKSSETASAPAADGLTFRFRPARPHYFHEDPDAFEIPRMVYHPVKPGVRAWKKSTRNSRPPVPQG